MSLLFVNACMRENSRTERLARMWLQNYDGEVEELCISDLDARPLDAASLVVYNDSVASAVFEDKMFDVARRFAAAEEVLIAAPLWNFSIPAKLHDYLELVCTQGLTFDVGENGEYVSLCNLKKLTFVVTSGGVTAPANDHAFAYLRTLAEVFWHVPVLDCVLAEGLDMPGADVDALLASALAG